MAKTRQLALPLETHRNHYLFSDYFLNEVLPRQDVWRECEPEAQQALDRMFPRTFNCYSYGSRCPYYNLCFKGPGWDKPFDHGYVEREPHHAQEPKPPVIK